MPRTAAPKPAGTTRKPRAPKSAEQTAAERARRSKDIQNNEPQDGVDLGLTPHPTYEDVYINGKGQMVDPRGVALSYSRIKAAAAAEEAQIIGHEASTPAEYLKSVALDRRLPTYVRLEAAKAAAPYTDRKQPIAVEGTDGPPLKFAQAFSPEALQAKFSKEERKVFMALLSKLQGE